MIKVQENENKKGEWRWNQQDEEAKCAKLRKEIQTWEINRDTEK